MSISAENVQDADLHWERIPEMLPLARMKALAAELHAKYISAEPYPHIVIDDFFEKWVLDDVLAEFPSPKGANWELHDTPEEVKLQSKHERDIPAFTRQLLYALNSASFLEFLETLTGIKGLIGDPYFEGGGLHQIVPGGKLGIHVDFNKNRKYGSYRRLNLLVYLNKNWSDDYGGHFELWDRDMTHMVKKVAPVFNRVVIFSTSAISYHGHPDPLRCPRDVTRKSLALYYYAGEPAEASEATSRHSTLFRARPGETVQRNARQVLRDLVPPLLWRAASRVLKSPGA